MRSRIYIYQGAKTRSITHNYHSNYNMSCIFGAGAITKAKENYHYPQTEQPFDWLIEIT